MGGKAGASGAADEGYAVFGVRHLSPGAAWHLRAVLERRRPKVVLIEGPSDMDEMIVHFTHPQCRPPVAALAYTTDQPVETILYPFAAYSPELQALLWADAHGARARFIDLPSSVFLGLQRVRRRKLLERIKHRGGDGCDGGNGTEGAREEAEDHDGAPGAEEEGERYEQVCCRIAEMSGEFDYDSYWEGHFELTTDPEAFRLALNDLGRTLRELNPEGGIRHAETLVREAYMRRRIQETIASGVDPRDILVVVGACHAPVMTPDHPPMSDRELAALPSAPSHFTLMPFSYQRLSSRHGYGAGNEAPAYYELKWDCMRRGAFDEFPSLYLTSIARQIREKGTFRSTAEVIEGTRLARAVASLHDRDHPVKAELRAAAVALLGQGEYLPIAEAMQSIDVGMAIGVLPPGVVRTSIQDDFQRELRRLKLEKYYQGVAQDLDLDLRENRRVRSEEAAWLDLNRSSFLHRLLVLNIPFAVKEEKRQENANWAEQWRLRWVPESEIALVEAVLLGETVEVAAAYALRQRLEEAGSVKEAAEVVRRAGECALPAIMDQARVAVANIAADSSAFEDLALACGELALTVRYGDVRRFAIEPLRPLIEQLFRESALHMVGSANCDHETALRYLQAINRLNAVSDEFSDLVDEKLWWKELRRLAASDAHNPLLSGFCCALLLERDLMDDDELSVELSRRLSPGIDADLGAGWFEGLSKRNRYALLSRMNLWRHLEDYIASLDENEFRRALVFLRRAFEDFTVHERRQIAGILGEIWGIHEDTAAQALEKELTEEEQQKLDELAAMDFGDL